VPGDPHLQAHGHQDRRRLFRRRRARAARPHGRRSVRLGPPPASESYLKAELIVDACKATGAEAVHPGYGFLSERESFAKALEKAGIAFIGPPPKAIAAMGDKIESRSLRAKAGVNIVPGRLGDIATTDAAMKARHRHRLIR
jgi:propionyl-CoA carboxylase alpha chain